MAAPRFVPLLALALTATLTPRADATCTEVEGACLCTSTSGDVWDLTDLQTPEPTTTGDISGCVLCTGQWTYHFNFCGNALQQIGLGCLSTQMRNAYRVDGSISPRCEYMGQDALVGVPLTVTDLDDGLGDGISILYTDTIRTMTVNLRCETPVGLTPQDAVVGNANPVLEWYTDAVCTPGGGNGWLIVILMSVAAGIYVGGGVGYVKRQDPNAAIAPSSHPHIEYWRQVPGLVSDGIYFSRVTASSNVGFLGFLAPGDAPFSGGGKSYEEIDDGGDAEKAPLRISAKSGGGKAKPKPKPNPKQQAEESSEEESSSGEEEDGAGPIE